jgi:hypothetical protein
MHHNNSLEPDPNLRVGFGFRVSGFRLCARSQV